MDVARLTEFVSATTDENPLTALAATAELRRATEQMEAVLVRRARNSGASWAEIAAVLGVTKQAVHKKHGGRRLFGTQP